MSQQRPNDKIRVEPDLTEFDITAAEKEATYQEIKERENYNLPKNPDAKQPQCPKGKEALIIEALKHFQMA